MSDVNRQKWEYKRVAIRPAVPPKLEGTDQDALLAELGEDGWELVAVRSGSTIMSDVWFFKRPKVEATSDPA